MAHCRNNSLTNIFNYIGFLSVSFICLIKPQCRINSKNTFYLSLWPSCWAQLEKISVQTDATINLQPLISSRQSTLFNLSLALAYFIKTTLILFSNISKLSSCSRSQPKLHLSQQMTSPSISVRHLHVCDLSTLLLPFLDISGPILYSFFQLRGWSILPLVQGPAPHT